MDTYHSKTLPFCQLFVDDLADKVQDLVPRRSGLGIRRFPIAQELEKRCILLRYNRFHRLCAPTMQSQFGSRNVNDDGVGPGGEFAPTAECVQFFLDLQQRLLSKVFSQMLQLAPVEVHQVFTMAVQVKKNGTEQVLAKIRERLLLAFLATQVRQPLLVAALLLTRHR